MAIDVVKALKIENPASGGTQTDFLPTEINPAQDYLAGKGLSLTGSTSIIIDSDGSGNIEFTDLVQTTPITVTQLRFAKGLNTTGANVNTVAAPPTLGQALVATSATTAAWGPTLVLNCIEVSATASATAPTSTDALMTGMTNTPVAGSYKIDFGCDINSAVSGAAISVSIYVGGVQKADSLRKIVPFAGGTLTFGSARAYIGTQGKVTVNGSQAIEIRWSTSSSGPTTSSRTMNLLQVA